jgi:hypothetical protein
MKVFSCRGVLCVTLERGNEFGIVLYLCYFSGKWLKDLNVFYVSLSIRTMESNILYAYIMSCYILYFGFTFCL